MPGQQLPLRGHDQQGFSFPNILGLLGQRLSFEGTEFIFFGGRHRRQTTPNRYGPSPIPILGLIGGRVLKIATLMRPERQIPLHPFEKKFALRIEATPFRLRETLDPSKSQTFPPKRDRL